ncbi:hypothetical protein K491DRAFT_602203 [Lophiostoma macrostomum CBS 122681]|uniref:Cora-domain-containing protein n=1 Tax=Lophiostoma macrostomum CBS 122681 TaxID=1314788 RepID=A0A6A6T367_9PLEO|nr:hypothetical protein K491DRAFT_602203 [Lophiostoma macrostomum CBS 122681]
MGPERAKPTYNIHTAMGNDAYFIGDCYSPSPIAQEWEIQDTSKFPYLTHVKSLASSWKTLQHLVHFMEVGTTPLRWMDIKKNPGDREERANRVTVTQIDYCSGLQPRPVKLDSPSALREALQTSIETEDPSLRLFLVEDLSLQVIEQLGSRFDIDPLFFREHIVDYTWFNTRDPWVIPLPLMAGMKHRQWFRLRHARLRYYKSQSSFDDAAEESNSHNVFRRPDDDRNHWLFLDAPGSTVSITRTRTTVWVGKDKLQPNCTVGIVLIDPTVHEGFPLWNGHTNWLPIPSSETKDPTKPLLGSSLYDTIVQATAGYPWFKTANQATLSMDPQILVKPAIYTICAEWLVVLEYVKARLAQIEVELDKPKGFRAKGDVIERSLKRLHTWRRVVPVLREMVTEILEQDLPIAARLTSPAQMQNVPGGNMDDILPDFERIMKSLNELQDRVDRLSSIVTSEISIEDSRHSLEENHNLARLTWLATTFIPLSFVTGLFSMTDDLGSMAATFGWYFLAAVPLTIICMIVAARVGKSWKQDRKTKKEEKTHTQTLGVGSAWTDDGSVRPGKSSLGGLFGSAHNKNKGS